MNVSRALFDEMRRRMEHFRRSEQKVARFVLRNPEEVIHMRIVDLATEAKVSEPTVVRFCRCAARGDRRVCHRPALSTRFQYSVEKLGQRPACRRGAKLANRLM